jgi:hypothetical protein
MICGLGRDWEEVEDLLLVVIQRQRKVLPILKVDGDGVQRVTIAVQNLEIILIGTALSNDTSRLELYLPKSVRATCQT